MKSIKFFTYGIAILVLSLIIVKMYGSIAKHTVKVKIISLDKRLVGQPGDFKEKFYITAQNLTDNKTETFINEDNFWAFKYNNAEIFYSLKKDSLYTLKVSGFGKSIITDYRNIITVDGK
jgi:hypothetical protein